MLSKDEEAFFAMALTSSGSNLAESSSLTMILATFVPSVAPGGDLAPPEKAWVTVSLILLEDF